MIQTMAEYEKAQQELQTLEDWLETLQTEYPVTAKGMTKASVRRMIARLHEELGEYEAACELSKPVSP